MNPNREELLFALALTKPAAERAAWLDRECAGDAALRQRVEALLQAHDKAGGFLEGNLPKDNGPSGTIRLSITPDEKPGEKIGPYKIREKIGEGGCGIVYVAEQEHPMRRRVALKVIKLGMDTKSVMARFEAERQALAMMDHPNIAKVLDAGATETGRPFFVMELVRGIRITEYCDQNRLDTQQRLDLFIQVCHAVQHAHQKGIIHRDIKPSNILVTLHDGVPVPKVIDFGIAKATEGRLTDLTVYTELHQFIGTPAYMSPEQAEMSGLDIDTRSDIYSLGVLLYELLTGKTPFDAKELIESGLDAMRRTIREKEPQRPSTRLSTMLGADLTDLAKRHGAEPPRLVHLIRGDLDWIVMKCLEKDRTRRYDTANGLAMDLKRHINNETVVARPQSSAYRFQKLVRRNKLAFAAGGAVAVALVVGVIASTLQAVRATRAEREQSRLRLKSETEAAKATAISDFLQQLLSSANPDALKGSEYTVRQLLDDFSTGMANQLENQPEVEAAVRATIGRAYYRLGVADKALAQHERALTLRRRIFGEQSEPVAESLVDNAWVCFEQQQYAKGEPYVREALEIYRKRGTAGQPVISGLWVLQKLVSAQERIAEVDAVTEEALTIAGKTPGVEFPELASMLHGLAESKNRQAKYAEAEQLSLKAVAMHRRLHGAEHLETAWALLSLGTALRGQQKLAEAEVAVREALRIFRKQYSSGHKSVDLAMIELKAVLEARGDSAAVEALYREILAGQRAALGNDSPAVAETLSSLGASLYAQGKLAEAEKASREAMDIILKHGGQDLVKLSLRLRQWRDTLRSQAKAADVEKMYEQVILAVRQKLSETNAILGQLHRDFGVFLREGGKSDEAIEHYHKSLLIRRTIPDDGLAETLRDMGYVLVDTGKYKDAEPYLREALALFRKLHPEEDVWGTAWTTLILAQALLGQQKWPEAEQAYREALVAYSKTEGIGGDGYAGAVQSLARLLKSENKLAEAETLLKDLLSQQRQSPGGQNIAAALTLLQLADVLNTQKKADEAVNRYREALEIASNLRADATNANALNGMAWQLATAENPTSWDVAVAVELAQKAVAATSRKAPGILDTLAAAYAAAGEFTNAVSVQQEAIAKEAIAILHNETLKEDFASRLKLYESNTPYHDHNRLAVSTKVLLEQGKFAEAEPLARECLALREKLIPDDWRTFNARSMLGGSLLAQKKYAEAEPLLLSGYEGMKQREDKMILAGGKLRLKETLQRLVQLYEVTGRPEKAAEWKKKLELFNNEEAEKKAATAKEAAK